MFDWPFEMPNVGDETEYGTVVYMSEDCYSRYIDWLEPIMEEAQKRGLDIGGSEEMNFLQELDIDIFVKDYGAPPFYGTVFIGIGMSSEKGILMGAKEALKSLGKRK